MECHPRGRVNGSPEVEEEDRCNAAAVQKVAWVLRWLNDIDISTEYPHADRACDATDHQQLPTSKLIN